MIHNFTTKATLASSAVAFAMTAGAAMAELNTINLESIVGNHTDVYTVNHVLPFFNETLKEASGGKITARTVPYTELGLAGFELMNLLKLGTNDISWGVPGYVAGDSPVVEGLELPGLTGDYATMFKVQDAYHDIFDRELREKFNAKLISWSQQPALQGYCKLSDDEIANFSLAVMEGKNTRVHSTSFADFAESMGAVPVTMPFADVIPALERGVVDCALTSPSAAYGYGIGQVANAVVNLNVGYSTHFYAMNLDTWNGLNEETQAFLTEHFNNLNQALRDYTPTVQVEMAKCLADGPCSVGEPAGMAYVELNEADSAELKKRVEATVLPRWAERAGAASADEWNASAGQVLGMTISAK
jgi:TRAP-type C4-dicarboxylate transport system substrate-binding protein